MKKLTGITWGSTQEVLATTYKTYLRPVLEYGCQLLSTASTDTCNALDNLQNKPLRIITGGRASTPLKYMEIQTGIEPLETRRENKTLILVEKCMRLNVNHWRNDNWPYQTFDSDNYLEHGNSTTKKVWISE